MKISNYKASQKTEALYLIFLFFFNFILFLNLKHCISFAKHQSDA